MSDSRNYQRRINQKLFYARQLLEIGSGAATEAAIWHLSVAYKAWLAEIASDIHHPLENSDNSSAEAMVASTSKHIPAALAECVELEKHDTSWLARLIAYNGLVGGLINIPPKSTSPNLIALNETPELSLPGASQVLNLATELESMIERYREAMQEY